MQKTLDDLVKDIIREYPGFVVPARGFWPENMPIIEYSREKDNYSWDCDNRNCKGEVTGFSWNDKIPKFGINIDKNWHRGCQILAGGIDAGVGFIPLVKDHDTEEFHIPENNKWLHTTIRLATAEEIKEHKEKLDEIKKALS